MESEKLFLSKTYGKVDIKKIAHILKEKIINNPDLSYTISVGSDSQTNRESKIVEAITIHEVGHYGIYFYRSKIQRKFKGLHEKLLNETQNSLEVATKLLHELEKLFDEDGFDYTEKNLNLQLHCDIGTKGTSSNYIKEVMGYVKGTLQNNYEIVMKPNSYAASSVADRISKPHTNFRG